MFAESTQLILAERMQRMFAESTQLIFVERTQRMFAESTQLIFAESTQLIFAGRLLVLCCICCFAFTVATSYVC